MTAKKHDAARKEADRLLDEGHAAHQDGDAAKALKLYRRAVELAPDWSATHYSVGFVHKYARRWKESLEANLRAHELDPGNEAATWNAAIAATALSDWKTARRLWASRDIDLPPGDGDPASDFGSVVIRINPEGNAETVWAQRIDPVRAILLSIPLPESGHRFRDLVLHDGAAEGYRKDGEHQVPVFNALQTLKPSELRTFAAEVVADSEEEINALEDMGREVRVAAEDWSGMENLCLRCSYGVPHRHRRVKKGEAPEWNPERRVGIAAADPKEARALLDRWCAARKGREVREFFIAKVGRPKAKARAGWWNSSLFIKDTDSSAETH
jgi:hypothetical protein